MVCLRQNTFCWDIIEGIFEEIGGNSYSAFACPCFVTFPPYRYWIGMLALEFYKICDFDVSSDLTPPHLKLICKETIRASTMGLPPLDWSFDYAQNGH